MDKPPVHRLYRRCRLPPPRVYPLLIESMHDARVYSASWLVWTWISTRHAGPLLWLLTAYVPQYHVMRCEAMPSCQFFFFLTRAPNPDQLDGRGDTSRWLDRSGGRQAAKVPGCPCLDSDATILATFPPVCPRIRATRRSPTTTKGSSTICPLGH